MELKDTVISSAGVFRCCVHIASEYEGQSVEIGYKSKCTHCGEKFTLVEGTPYPIWTPDIYLLKGDE